MFVWTSTNTAKMASDMACNTNQQRKRQPLNQVPERSELRFPRAIVTILKTTDANHE